jgi:hypothetical protein
MINLAHKRREDARENERRKKCHSSGSKINQANSSLLGRIAIFPTIKVREIIQATHTHKQDIKEQLQLTEHSFLRLRRIAHRCFR